MRLVDEYHHNTPEQVETYTRDAVAIADRVGLAGEDRAALLPQIVQLVAAKRVMLEPTQPLGFMIPSEPAGR